MRNSEDLPLDPEVAADLEVIDATLAGRIVDPSHGELAEITLFLAAERQPASEEVAGRLDARIHARLAPGRKLRPSRRPIFLRSALGGGVAAFAAAVAAVAVLTGGSTQAPPVLVTPGTGTATSSGPVHGPGIGPPASYRSLKAAPATSGTTSAGRGTASGTTGASSPGANAPASAAVAAPGAPAPVPNGRRIVQSADLQLTAANNHVSDVAQEVFNVVSQVDGVVANSSVTAAGGNQGYASFSLSIPSASLQLAMTRLSALPYAHVAARTDATEDVNNQYLSDVRKLQDARALRTSLLKQLATAYTDAQIQSITAQIHDAEASISSDEATLNRLRHRISFSTLTVEINATPVYVPVVKPHTTTGGFTLSRAVHDSVRVLTVAAGVALIVLAALVPIALLVALASWIAYWVRRRRREHALDSA